MRLNARPLDRPELLTQSTKLLRPYFSNSDCMLFSSPRPTTTTTTTTIWRMNNSKLSNVRFHCEYTDCQKSYTVKRNLRNHVLSLHQNRKFHCEYPYCQKSYTKKQYLADHVSSYHENQVFHCEYQDCQKVYFSKRSLTNHVLSHHESRVSRLSKISH